MCMSVFVCGGVGVATDQLVYRVCVFVCVYMDMVYKEYVYVCVPV